MKRWLLSLALAAGLAVPGAATATLPTASSSPPVGTHTPEVNYSPHLVPPLTQRWPEFQPRPSFRTGVPSGNLNQQPFLLPPEATGLPRMVPAPGWLFVPGGSSWW